MISLFVLLDYWCSSITDLLHSPNKNIVSNPNPNSLHSQCQKKQKQREYTKYLLEMEVKDPVKCVTIMRPVKA